MGYDQTNRILAIDTSLGADQVLLTELEGEDAISRPYVMKVKLASELDAAQMRTLLGSAVTLWMGRPTDSTDGPTGIERQPVHGMVRRLTRGLASRGAATEWRAEVVPMVWFLSRTSDCRIFQEKTIPQIIEEILGLHGVTDYRMKTTGSYEPLEYCVQYRESALDFISRLMELAGLFYWHEHAEGRHTLVIADNSNSAPQAEFPALPIAGRRDTAAVRRLDEELVIRSGKWTLRDFNFETPSETLEVSEPTVVTYEQMRSRERYDYPGLYQEQSPGTAMARLQIEQEEAHHQRRHGESGLAGLYAGLRVTFVVDTDPEVLITEVRHVAEDYSHWTDEMWGRREPKVPFYDNEFVCIPKRVPFRSERVTPKPFVHGPQTAIVTGPGGEEIHTDEYGRIKVKFHWDRINPKDDTSSCWIRVSQGWAGATWGQIHIPRIGQEVIVDFLEGDPDRPIVTGRVYNAENMVPYGLPANKTQSGIKSNSSKGGGGSNEFRFEDKKGSEQVFFHAEKDLDSEVENNETRKVGGKGTGNRTTTIKNDEKLTVGRHKTTDVTGNFKETIVGTETRNVTGSVSETFAASETRTIGASITETVGASYTLTIGASFTQTIGASFTQTVGASVAITAGASITLTAPSIKQVGPSWFKTGMASGDAYVFKTGTAAIKNDNSGISLNNGGVKIDNFGLKLDTFGMAIKTGGVEIKNKALKTNSEAFAAKRGLKLYSA